MHIPHVCDRNPVIGAIQDLPGSIALGSGVQNFRAGSGPCVAAAVKEDILEEGGLELGRFPNHLGTFVQPATPRCPRKTLYFV